MSTTTNSTTSITLPKHKTDNKSKSKKFIAATKPKLLFDKSKVNKVTGMTSEPQRQPHHPSSCGPLQFENEFVQFYSELYKSAVLFSDRNYQQMLLFPGQGQGHGHMYGQHQYQGTKGHRNLSPSNHFGNLFLNIPQCQNQKITSPTKQRNVKKAQRRLSGGSGVTGSTGSGVNAKPSTTTSSDYNSAESGGGSLNKKTFAQHFLLAAANSASGFPSTSTPTGVTAGVTTLASGSKNGKIPKLKRRVSFSKNSPRSRSRSNSNTGGGQGGDSGVNPNNGHIPWITIQENTWSSEMDETDTTETEEDNDGQGTSTLGEGDDFVFAKSETGTWDGDNENSTTDEGNREAGEKMSKSRSRTKEVEMTREVEVEARFKELSTSTIMAKGGDEDKGQGQGEDFDMPESEA